MSTQRFPLHHRWTNPTGTPGRHAEIPQYMPRPVPRTLGSHLLRPAAAAVPARCCCPGPPPSCPAAHCPSHVTHQCHHGTTRPLARNATRVGTRAAIRPGLLSDLQHTAHAQHTAPSSQPEPKLSPGGPRHPRLRGC